jgi:carboxyl-terminal processing protease
MFSVRWLLTAVLLVAVAFLGAQYVATLHAPGIAAGQATVDDESGKIASVNIDNALDAQVVDQQLLDLAYRQVERAYYKPVDPQVLVHGEHTALQQYLSKAFKAKHVAVMPALPQPQGGDETQDVHMLDTQLAYAQDHYAQYLGKDGRNQLTEAALSGMLDSLRDPYTVYLSPEQIRSLNEQLNGGDFGGIGVLISQLKNGQVILQPIDGLPAARAGMRGDEVLQTVNGQSVHGLALEYVERMIRGPQGTVVTLVAHPYKQTAQHEYHITREIIHLPSVHQKMEDGFNYIRLTDFGETSAAEVRKALAAGKTQGAKGIILDLRDNGGGLLTAAVDISSLFIPKGAIVTEIDRYGNRDVQYASGTPMQGVQPLVILVNGFTASASEITAGALQDYKLATLIGTKTFGKGVVQGIFSMPNGGALKITTQRYITPNGRDIQHKGIQPDITVPQSPDLAYIDTLKDKQLAAAKAYLKRLIR